ncbi:unnamed protein product, partial [Ectocarpus sp. 4 AP-2014]
HACRSHVWTPPLAAACHHTPPKQQPVRILLPLLCRKHSSRSRRRSWESGGSKPLVFPCLWRGAAGCRGLGRTDGGRVPAKLGVQKVSPPPVTVLPRSSIGLPGDALLREVLGRCQREVVVIPPQPQQPIRPKRQPQQPGLRGISRARGHLPELAVDKPSGRARGRRSVGRR